MRIILTAALFILPLATWAQDIQQERVEFAPGATGATLDGTITGDEVIDYVLAAKAGQHMGVEFAPDNPSAYFNLLPGTDPTAIHIGSVAGNSYDGLLKRDGEYRIRVYLMRSAARRNEAAHYRLTVSITGEGMEVIRDDYADGLAGGPDHWQVGGLGAGGTLNLREAPGTASAVLDRLAPGEVLENGGCRMLDDAKWCRVMTAQGLAGWVSGDYLREAVAPGSDIATGMIPCATAESQPMGQCPFRVSRGKGGTASVWVTLPGGGERYLDFREGRLIGSDPGMEVQQERSGDLNLIRISGTERYELPDAILYGG